MSVKKLLLLGLVLGLLGLAIFVGVKPGDSSGQVSDSPAVEVNGVGDSSAAKSLAGQAGVKTAQSAQSAVRSVKLFGRVEADGGTVSGAEVVLAPAEGEPVFAQSDGSGRFEFRDVPRGVYRLYAQHAGRLSYAEEAEIPLFSVSGGDRDVGPLVLKLVPGLSLEVKLVSADGGVPVRNGSVTALGLVERAETVDGSGVARLTLSPGNWVITASAPQFQRARAVLDLTTADALTLMLKPAGLVSGVVRDAAGAPLADVSILLSGLETTFKTDDEGRYSVPYASLQHFFGLRFDLMGYAPHRENRLKFPPGGTEMTLDVVMNQLGGASWAETQCRGQVVDPDGFPLEGAVVIYGTRGTSACEEATTDADGRFALDVPGFARGFSKVLVEKEGYQTLQSQLPVIEKDVFQIVLPPVAPISGTVYDPEGIPLAGARLVAYWEEFQGRLDDPYREGLTDQNGLFRLHGTAVPALIYVTAPGFAGTVFKLEPGEDHELILQRWGVLMGRVVHSGDVPLTRYQMKVREDFPVPSEDRNRIRALAETGLTFARKDGSFRVDRLQPGAAYTVTVTLPDGRVQSYRGVIADPDDRAEELILEFGPDTFEVAGRVVDAQGKSQPGVDVELFGFDPRDFHSHSFLWANWFSGSVYSKAAFFKKTRTDHAGRFRFLGAPADFRVNLVLNQREAAPTSLMRLQQEKREDVRRLEVVLERGGAIEVVINEAVFSKGARIGIQNLDAAGWGVTEEWSLGKNRSWFLNVPSGSYRVTANQSVWSMDGFQLALDEMVTIGDGVVRTVRLGFEARFEVRGRILFGDHPFSRGLVYLIGIGKGDQQTLTDEAGYFAFHDVAGDGEYWLSAPGGYVGDGQDRFNVVLSHPNTAQLQVEDEDVVREFEFQSVGSVRFRLEGGERVRSVYAYMGGGSPIRFPGRLNNGMVVIEALPPGPYDVIYYGEDETKFKVGTSFEIPAEGGLVELDTVVAE